MLIPTQALALSCQGALPGTSVGGWGIPFFLALVSVLLPCSSSQQASEKLAGNHPPRILGVGLPLYSEGWRQVEGRGAVWPLLATCLGKGWLLSQVAGSRAVKNPGKTGVTPSEARAAKLGLATLALLGFLPAT